MFNIKDMFSDETEILEDKTTDINNFNSEKDMEDNAFAIQEGYNSDCTIVRLYMPVSKTIENTIIDAIKNKDLCIVNYGRLSEEETQLLHAKLQGATQIIEGVTKRINTDTIIYGCEHFVIDTSSID